MRLKRLVHKKFSDSNSGQTLIEALVAIAIGVVVLTALTSASLVAMSASGHAKNKVLASRYTQEAQEWIRFRRDQEGWDDFYTNLGGLPATFCIPTIDYDLISQSYYKLGYDQFKSSVCTDQTEKLDNFFFRNAYFVVSEADQVKVSVITKWPGSQCPGSDFCNESISETYLSKWQD